MRVIVKEFGKNPMIKEIDGELETMQKIVGGYIEVPYLANSLEELDIALVVNEEGRNQNLNPTLALVNSSNEVVYCIVGQYFFCSRGNEDFESITDEQLKYIHDNLVYNGAYNDTGLEIDILYV